MQDAHAKVDRRPGEGEAAQKERRASEEKRKDQRGQTSEAVERVARKEQQAAIRDDNRREGDKEDRNLGVHPSVSALRSTLSFVANIRDLKAPGTMEVESRSKASEPRGLSLPDGATGQPIPPAETIETVTVIRRVINHDSPSAAGRKRRASTDQAESERNGRQVKQRRLDSGPVHDRASDVQGTASLSVTANAPQPAIVTVDASVQTEIPVDAAFEPDTARRTRVERLDRQPAPPVPREVLARIQLVAAENVARLAASEWPTSFRTPFTIGSLFGHPIHRPTVNGSPPDVNGTREHAPETANSTLATAANGANGTTNGPVSPANGDEHASAPGSRHETSKTISDNTESQETFTLSYVSNSGSTGTSGSAVQASREQAGRTGIINELGKEASPAPSVDTSSLLDFLHRDTVS
jgi:hypothetical protein